MVDNLGWNSWCRLKCELEEERREKEALVERRGKRERRRERGCLEGVRRVWLTVKRG